MTILLFTLLLFAAFVSRAAMKPAALIVFCAFAPPLFSQQAKVDTMRILHGSDWQTAGNWFGSEKVILKPLRKLPDPLDTSGLSEQEMENLLNDYREHRFGERISFDKAGNFKYTYFLFCGTGATHYEVRTFEYGKSRVKVEYKVIPWNQAAGSFHSSVYSILKWAPDEIVLSLEE